MSTGPSITVRRVTPEDRAAWDALVARSRSRHFFFCRDYMTYHADRFEDWSLLVLADGQLVGALPASRHGDTVVSHGGLTFGGLIADVTLTARRTVEALAAVKEFCNEAGVHHMVYKPAPHIYHVTPGEEDLYALFVHGARLIRRDVSSTVRPASAPAFSKGRRAAVRQARSAGVSVVESTRVADFMRLEAESLRERYGVAPAHTPDEMAMLARRFPAHITLFAGLQMDRMLAGVLVFETDVVAHAQYIGASAEGRELHALDAVIEHLITERYRAKRFFDFGISTTGEGRELNEGLIRNKESFGGRATVYDWYQLDIA